MATNIIAGNTYTFKNLYSGKMLNLYGGYTTNGTNVCQYSADGSDEQKWTLDGSNRLYTYGHPDKCLDRYNSPGSLRHNNADIWDNTDDANQKLVINTIGSYVTIKIAGTALFLTAYHGTSNGGNTDARCAPGATGNVFWATSSDENVVEAAQQKWIMTIVEQGSNNSSDVVIPSTKYTYLNQRTYPWIDGNYGISTDIFHNYSCPVMACTMFMQILANDKSIIPEDLYEWGVMGMSGGYPFANWDTTNAPVSYSIVKVASTWSSAKNYIYNEIINGRPVVIHLKDNDEGTHFVVGYGLKAGTTTSNITYNSIYVLDPWTTQNNTLQDTMNYDSRWSIFDNIRIAQ